MSYPAPSMPWWIVARREIMAKLTQKAFWISTIVVVVILIGSFFFTFLFANSQDKMTVGVTDEAGAQVVALAAQSSGRDIQSSTLPQDEIRAAVEDGDIEAGLVRTDDGWDLLVDSIETNVGDVQQAVSTYMTNQNARELGIDPAALQKGSNVTLQLTGEQVEQDAAIALVTGLVFSVLFFMSALTYGLQIAQSVVEEKESRIVEILTAAVPTRHLLIGKVLGNTIMAMGQLLIFLTVGVIGISLTEFGKFLPLLAPNIGWFIVFFLVGFAALSCLWAATGAMATRVQDLNNTTMPLTFILMGVYFAGFLARGTAAQVLSYVPIVSSVIMPQRLLSGQSTWIDAVIALVLCLIFMGAAILVGAQIYRRGILKTSGILNLKEAFSRAG
ncbi:ABC transporter permease [Tessaracoccus antarcticus]|uniref:ABC transporter permease n=1 Tax=Tessaracoccus antarcticus TaxID=2479848 RepID=A0A3M0G3U2_9ACTN|nr:ABC transporter permease [Tessaracoccus antarcticus]RMB59640.1 ABC transporter permease [Tessaracoccus antarcticus]